MRLLLIELSSLMTLVGASFVFSAMATIVSMSAPRMASASMVNRLCLLAGGSLPSSFYFSNSFYLSNSLSFSLSFSLSYSNYLSFSNSLSFSSSFTLYLSFSSSVSIYLSFCFFFSFFFFLSLRLYGSCSFSGDGVMSLVSSGVYCSPRLGRSTCSTATTGGSSMLLDVVPILLWNEWL